MTELEQLKKRRDLLENEWVELREELSLIEMDLEQLEEQIEELENTK